MFKLSFNLRSDLSRDTADRFWDEFIDEAIAAHGLVFGGGGATNIEGTVGDGSNDTTTEEHRRMVETWLRSRAEVVSCTVGPLQKDEGAAG